METHADRVVAEILHGDDLFVIEVGRLTLLFSRIEDCLVCHARQLAALSEDEEMKEAATAPKIVELRVLEKRDFLKRVVADIACFHSVDYGQLHSILDELGTINRLRRMIVHGWIRWSEAEMQPVLVDSRGLSVPAWPLDVLDLNLKVLKWYQDYYEEQRTFMRAILNTYTELADRLSKHSKASPALRELIRGLKARACSS